MRLGKAGGLEPKMVKLSQLYLQKKYGKEVKKVPKLIYLPHKVMQEAEVKGVKGSGFIGGSNYRTNKIYIDKISKRKEQIETIAHEIGHFKLRQLQHGKISEKASKPLKKTSWYKEFRKEGYSPKKALKEIYAEYYGQTKANIYKDSKSVLERLRKRNPSAYQIIKEFINRKAK